MKADVINWDGKVVGTCDLPEEVFKAAVRADLMHQVVRWQLASRRQGTHMTKTKGLVSGGGKKPFKQKGTGNARQGSSRSPLMPGGGTAFGPQPRDYSFSIPKQVRRKALASALSLLQERGAVKVLESVQSTDGKTKEFDGRLKRLGLKKALVVDGRQEPLVARATGNLPGVRYMSADGVNVYDLLRLGTLLVTKAGVEVLTQRIQGEQING